MVLPDFDPVLDTVEVDELEVLEDEEDGVDGDPPDPGELDLRRRRRSFLESEYLRPPILRAMLLELDESECSSFESFFSHS